MTQNEIITLRANLLGGMDAYVRDVVGDEEVFDVWSTFGVPDGADEDDLIEIAEDEDIFAYTTHIFSKIVRKQLTNPTPFGTIYLQNKTTPT